MNDSEILDRVKDQLLTLCGKHLPEWAFEGQLISIVKGIDTKRGLNMVSTPGEQYSDD